MPLAGTLSILRPLHVELAMAFLAHVQLRLMGDLLVELPYLILYIKSVMDCHRTLDVSGGSVNSPGDRKGRHYIL